MTSHVNRLEADHEHKSELAREAFEAGRLEQARALSEALIRDAGADPVDFYNLGQVCIAQEDFEAAIEALGHAIGSVPGASYARALAHERRGEITQARSDYLEALRQAPANADVLADIGTLELTAGRPEIAIGYLRQAADLDATANWQYADALRELGRRSEARDALNTAIDAGEPRAHLDLATLDAEDGDVDTAEQHFQSAIKTGTTLARSEFAFFLLDNGENERARRVAQAAVDDGDGWSYRPLALAFQRLGNTVAAQRYFAEAEAFGDTVDE